MTDQDTTSVTGPSGHLVIANTQLSPDVHRLVLAAPRVASVCLPGQFVIVRLGDGAERIPLTIAESDTDAGSIVLVIQAVGKSTRDLVALSAGDHIHDIAGPLGHPSDLVADGLVVCVAGGVGAAVVYPIARRLAELGVDVVTVLGARNEASLVYADEFAALGELITCTDDGTAGRNALRLGRRGMPAGRYRLTLVATDAGGKRSNRARRRFSLVATTARKSRSAAIDAAIRSVELAF